MAASPGLQFMGLLHQTDEDRELNHDRISGVGRLDQSLDEVKTRAGRPGGYEARPEVDFFLT